MCRCVCRRWCGQACGWVYITLNVSLCMQVLAWASVWMGLHHIECVAVYAGVGVAKRVDGFTSH